MSVSDVAVRTRGWKPWYSLWALLLCGWAVSAADRSITGPVVTWMIQNDVAFFQGVANPHALGGLIGGLFFAGYMLTQFPGGYLGDRYGYRSLIVVSLLWAGVVTILTGVLAGLFAFIALRVITGLGEGVYYSNDRSLISETTPLRQRSLGMGVVIAGLSIGITIATVGTPWMIKLGETLLPGETTAWRMPFLLLGVATTLVGVVLLVWFKRSGKPLPLGRTTLHLMGFSGASFAAIIAVYYIAHKVFHLSELWVAIIEVFLAAMIALYILSRKGGELAPVAKNRDLLLIYVAAFAILWNLWFFSFWAVDIIGTVAKNSSFLQAALVAGFNAGAGLLGFPVGGWLSDRAVKRGFRRKPMLLAFTLTQAVLTFVFTIYATNGQPNLWVMAALLFTTSLFFNALQPISQALTADIAPEENRGSAFGMWNMIGETGAVLSPAISGVLRDATGSWAAALYLDGAIVFASFCVLALVRETRRGPTGGAGSSAPEAVKA